MLKTLSSGALGKRGGFELARSGVFAASSGLSSLPYACKAASSAPKSARKSIPFGSESFAGADRFVGEVKPAGATGPYRQGLRRWRRDDMPVKTEFKSASIPYSFFKKVPPDNYCSFP
jgi:hypothetical protein